MSKRVMGAVVAAAVAIVAVLVALQLRGGDGPSKDAWAKSATQAETLLKGIPQTGAVLGTPDAPVTIVEYVDYKCPVCAAASQNIVPATIKKYVRTGVAKMELRPILLGAGGGQNTSNLGADSEIGAFGGLAAAKQNKMWQFTEVMMANQGAETDAWITEGVITDAATAVGLDIAKWKSDFKSDAVVNVVFGNIDAATADKYTGTPFFVVTGPGGTERFSTPDRMALMDAAVKKVNVKA